MKTIQEIDFWDGDRRPKLHHSPQEISFPVTTNLSSIYLPILSSSSSKRDRCSITTFQESTHVAADHLQETKKMRKISTIRLFGTNITTTTTVMDDDLEDGGDDWEKRQKAAKGKEIVLIDELLEPDYNSQFFNPTFEDGHDNSRALVIYEPSDKKKEKKKKAQPRKSKKKYTEQIQVEASAPLPPMMQQEINNRGGSDPFFLFAKDLTNSDVGSNLNRLFINQSDKLMEALTEEEDKMVNSGLTVWTMDSHAGDRHHDYEMKLTRWNVGAYKIVLKKEWMKFVRANNLQEGDRVEGWGYRKQGDFCLALNVIRKVA